MAACRAGLTAGPVGGEAGYLLAAEAVLRALVDAEQRGHGALAQSELVHALGAAKPLGASATDVLARMRRERLLRPRRQHGSERWWTAAPAGRQFLARDSAARDDAWTVRDAGRAAGPDLRRASPGAAARTARRCRRSGASRTPSSSRCSTELLARGQLDPTARTRRGWS